MLSRKKYQPLQFSSHQAQNLQKVLYYTPKLYARSKSFIAQVLKSKFYKTWKKSNLVKSLQKSRFLYSLLLNLKTNLIFLLLTILSYFLQSFMFNVVLHVKLEYDKSRVIIQRSNRFRRSPLIPSIQLASSSKLVESALLCF